MYKKRTYVIWMLAAVLMLSLCSVRVKVWANDFDTAEEIGLGEQVSDYLDQGEVKWYKLSIPEDVRDQEIQAVVMPKSDFYGALAVYVYNEDAIQYFDDYASGSANDSGYWTINIGSSDGFEKGKTYYFKLISALGWGDHSNGSYNFKVTGDYLKGSKLSVTAPKGKKTISVSTIEDATISVSANNRILKSGSSTKKKVTLSSGSGTAKIKLSRKLKVGDKLTITVKRDGYETKKLTKKIV